MKTSYYAITNSTGGIAISRYPPSGWRVHYPALAPSTDLLNGFKQKQCTIENYIKIYHQQLDKLDPKKVWADLHEIASGWEPTLLCFEKPKAKLAASGVEPLSNHPDLWFCHRRLVADWLESSIGVSVPEALKEKPGFKHLGFIRSGLDELKAWCPEKKLRQMGQPLYTSDN